MIALLIDTAKLDAILDQDSLRGAMIGSAILDSQGALIYGRNADIRMMPASNQKVLTCAFAMGTLGPDKRLKTRFWVSQGRLIVDAEGDPLLTAHQLSDAKKKLKFTKGEVYVRQSFSPGTPPAWEWDDLTYSYAPEIRALTVDQAQFDVYAANGRVEPVRQEFGIKIRRGRTSGGMRVSFDIKSSTVSVDGSLPGSRTKIGTFALPRPDRAAARILGGELQQWNGAPPKSAPNLTIQSKPIKELIKLCLEPSDNQIAEHLLLAAGGSSAGDAYSKAAENEAAFFEKEAGITKDSALPRDGSGLSRQNLVTPRALSRVLRWTTQQAWAEDFRAALAAPGEGTMASRLKDRNFAGKTGTIYAVSSLSGLLFADDPGRTMTASLMMNHASVSGSTLRGIQDRFFEALFGSGESLNGTNGEKAALEDNHAHAHARPFDGHWLY